MNSWSYIYLMSFNLLQISDLWPVENGSRYFLNAFEMPSVVSDSVLLIACQDVPNSSGTFLAWDLELAVSPRNPGLVQWGMSFADQIWVLEMLTAIGMTLFLSLFNGNTWTKQIPHEFILVFLIQLISTGCLLNIFCLTLVASSL